MKNKEKLKAVHEKFLESIKDFVLGEFIVGSFVYVIENDLTEKTDLDIICVVEESKLNNFLKSKFLKGLIEPEVALDVLRNKISDYLVLKFNIDEILLSVDVISPDFFKEMCNIDLAKRTKGYTSYKYGNEPQPNSYKISEFDGTIYTIQKKSEEYRGGYSIELPLLFIYGKSKYLGMPLIKFVTNKIFVDKEEFIEKNLNKFYFNFARILVLNYPNLVKEKYEEYILNTLTGREKLPEKYRLTLLKKIYSFICMEKKIESIKKEIYELFRDNTDERRYSYVQRNWIFPNHFDIMIDLVKDMCSKYDGDIVICELAVLLHDVGLVYGRESASPEGHEERGIEYARNIMNKNEVSSKMQKEVIECIMATSAKEEPTSINEKIVRTADALSQFIGVHFFAKAAFSGEWNSYVDWLKKKVTNNFKKICFEDEIKKATPIKDYILSAIQIYEKNKLDYLKEEN